MLKKTLIAVSAIPLTALSLTACGSDSAADNTASDDGKITMGFAQVGAESGWRHGPTPRRSRTRPRPRAST